MRLMRVGRSGRHRSMKIVQITSPRAGGLSLQSVLDAVMAIHDLVVRTLERIADRYRWDFVFTDNCSSDRTFECLERLAARDSRVRVYRFTRNFGFQPVVLPSANLRHHFRLKQASWIGLDLASLFVRFALHSPTTVPVQRS
jgi:hypothetical protein